jgi:hypothetical protein
VVQGTADFHDQVADASLSEAASVVDDTAALDVPVDVLDADAATREASIGGFLAPREGAAAGLAGWHDDLDLVECERQEAEVLEPPTARGQGLGRGLGNPFVVGTTRRGLTQEEDHQHGVDRHHIFDRVARFLAAIIARLLSRIVGTPDAPFGAIRPTRGEAGTGADAGAGGSDGYDGSCTGTTSALASVAVTPRRFASSVTDRVGAAPSARSVGCRTVYKM